MNADSNSHSLNDLKCIWMTSGLVEYKLCNFRFNCENCEFDKVFRNNTNASDQNFISAESGSPGTVDDLINRINDEHFDEKIIYLKNQLVMKKLFGNVYYLGINPVVLHLLENFKSVTITDGNNIKKGEAFIRIEGDWGKLEFCSPIDFMLIEKFITAAPKLNKWIGIVTTNEDGFSQFNSGSWIDEKNKCLAILKKKIEHNPEVGKTALDGGVEINSIDQLFGKEEYLILINEFFQ